ncbi:hypothetical protein ACQVUC_28555 [Bacillus paranthracis]
MKNIKISTIRKPDGKFPNRLDPTFKWIRKSLVTGGNTVFFRKDLCLHVIRVKTQ